MSDATPAYRGYRLQTLYTLGRILESDESSDLVFHPEGAEDFSIWENDERLIEVVQVKAYSSNLTLSSLSPNKPDSFLYRVNNLLSTHKSVQVNLASFGNIGPELQKAASEDGAGRQAVSEKLSDHGFLSVQDSKNLLHQLQLVQVSETAIRESVFATLRRLATGIDPQPAFEMLSFWLYICAEKRRKITRGDLIQRLNDVGRFIAERDAYHSEWFRSIIPIENSEIEVHTKERLLDEFYRGISARYEHILADIDKPRQGKLSEIHRGFKKNQVVIIHGASGQGKTTLAYRYLRDYFSEQWCFQIRLIENRQQALNIASALSGQARAAGIPIAIYIDVSPNDIGWDELIKQLASYKNIQVLVTAREEDFRRASISGAEIQFSEIELSFERSEAEDIYEFLVAKETPDRFLDFEDAWNRFGNSGPLMEFVYLITQGTSLRERLQQQVRRIQDEVRTSISSQEELEMLRLVAVASAFEARLKLRKLVEYLQLSSPQRTLELLEKEYLLRRSEDRTLVGGLHPLRSAILVEILTDPVLSPWVESASTCLPLLFEHDVESFLLYAFSRHRSDLEILLSALNLYQPIKWTATAGVIKALIWLGLKEYVEENLEIIKQFDAEASQTWTVLLDVDVADAMPGMSDQGFATLAPLLSEERRIWSTNLRNQQTDKSKIFSRSTQWLKRLSSMPETPNSELDWAKMAEVLFWIGRLEVVLPVSEWIDQRVLEAAVETLPLELLSDLSLGLFYSSPEDYQLWINRSRGLLLD